MKRISVALAAGAAAGAVAVVAGCSSGATSQSVNAPPRTVTATVTHQASPVPSSTTPAPTRHAATSTRPAPGPTVTVTATPAPAAPPAEPPANPPAPAQTTAMTNASAVVEQYYQDITDHNYAAAWALGGTNIAGESYDQYVAGFSTTASISLGTVSDFGASQVQAVLYATQTDGTVKVFEGTYTVSNGVLVGASIRQVQ